MKVLKSVLESPVFADEDKTHTTSLVNTLVLSSIVFTLIFIAVVILFVPKEQDRLLYAVALLPLFGGLLFVVRRGQPQLASILLTALFWVLMAIINYTSGGVRAPTFAGFVLPILIAGFLLGYRAGIFMAVMTILLGIGFIAVKNAEWFPPLRVYDDSMILFTQSIYFLVSAVLLYLVMRSMQMAMRRSLHSEQLLVDNNRLLQHEMNERERIELALRTSEEQYRQLFEANPHPMYVVDAATRMFLNVNNMMVEKYGYSRDEFLKMNLANLMSPEDIPPAEVSAVQFQKRDVSYSRSGPWRHLKKDGTDMFVEVAFHRMNYDGHNAMICTAYDLTDRLKAEAAVRRSEDMFSKIFQSVPVAIMISTIRERRIINANSYFLEITGYSAEEVMNRPINETGVLVPEEERDNWIKALANNGSVMGVEGQWQTKSGGIKDVLISLESIEVGGEACILGIGVDITERKRLEREQIEAEKLNLQLNKEREVLLLKERFVTTISHEFRTPLAIIMSSKDMLARYSDRLTLEVRQEKLQNIEEQTFYIMNLLDNVLLLGKAQARKLQFNPMLMDLPSFCKKLLEQIQSTDSVGHEYQFSSTGALDTVPGDQLLLHQILLNLLSNAIKYSPQGSEVRLEVVRDGDEAVVRVSDQGMGIPLEDQPHLFEDFYRASNAGQIKGTGLGLAIVKESVQSHGGSISYESAPDKGTVFTVRLPINPNH